MAESLANLLGDGDGPAIHMVKPVTANVKVAREGELVILQIGDSAIRMKWEHAMRIGQWLMAKGNESKLLAGDANKRFYIDKG